jgi:hypothetical protein
MKLPRKTKLSPASPRITQFTMDPQKSKVEELEEAKTSALDRHGDHAHQQKLTRRILFKLDTRLVGYLGAQNAG